MNKSDSIAELAKALIKVQKEMPPVEKNATNPFLKNKYADLDSTIQTSIPVMAKHGLSISQFPTSAEDKIGLVSILMHESGEWIEDTIYLPIEEDGNKAVNLTQTAGKEITYLRRYAWTAILGMSTDEDTDGNGGQPSKRKSQPAKKPTNGKMSLESAKKVKNSEGVLYIEIETEKLSHMYNQIVKTISNTPTEKPVDDLEYKRDAIEVILASRQ